MTTAECRCDSCQFDKIIKLLKKQEGKIMALQDDLQAVLVQVGKGTGEVLSKIADLESQLRTLGGLATENAEMRQQLEAASQTVSELKVTAQALDDVVPDSTPEPTPEPAPEPESQP